MSDLSGKKLLILGSTELIAQIVKKAQNMGVYVIVTDNKPRNNAPAKVLANKSYDISLADVDKIVELIGHENIDGVLTGFTDSYMMYYYEICMKSNLPCYGDKNAFKIAINKTLFKQSCREMELPIIPGESVSSYKRTVEVVRELGMPVILKPDDNSGSRGVIKCEYINDLKDAYEYALSFSKSKKVIVEKYMNCDNIDVTYFIDNGNACLSATSDRYVYISGETGSSTTSYSVYPSVYTERYLGLLDEKVKAYIKKYGFNNGMLSINSYVDADDFYFCEMCYRPSGGQHYYLIENQSGVDQLGLLIRFALSGNIGDYWNKQNETPYFNKTCAVLRIIGEANKRISSIEGIEAVSGLKNVIKAYSYLKEGDIIGADGTTAQVIATVWYYSDSIEQARIDAKKISEIVHVCDEDGNNLARIVLDER